VSKSLSAQIQQLEALRHDYGAGAAQRAERLLAQVQRARFRDAESLIRFHDTLLFLRAFPQSRAVAKAADRLLATIEPEVEHLRAAQADLNAFDLEPYSGVAGTVLVEEHTYEVARWLAQRYPKQVTANFNPEENYSKLVNALPRFMPLLEDDTFVEPDIPFERLLSGAGGEGREWLWLIEQFERLPIPLQDKTELYDALAIELQLDLRGSPASRTYARHPSEHLFIHKGPLIHRKQVSLADEFNSAPLPLRKLERAEGEQILDLAREALLVRQRELYGTTRGDADHVYETDAGRGILIYVWGLPPDRRLPLRAYHAGCTFKNGVPINYLESISLFDWAEVGFNTFYTYRDGETAWIYAKVLHILHQVAGTTCFSVYPYQLGHENEEAIQSGAFWFYRKLGFRPGRPELLALTEAEEKKIARQSKHRTSARTLRKLAAGHVFYEFDGAPRRLYDTFSTRSIQLRTQQWMAEHFDGNMAQMKEVAVAQLARTLDVDLRQWANQERHTFSNFAYVASMLPEIADWTSADRKAFIDIIRAKAAPEERNYLRLMQQHDRLKKAVVALGSSQPQ
jgi:hypothetical protein